MSKELMQTIFGFAKKEFNDQSLILRLRFEREKGRVLAPSEAIHLSRWLLGQSRVLRVLEIIRLLRLDQADEPYIDEFESKVYWSIGKRKTGFELAEKAYLKWGGDELLALIAGYKALGGIADS